MYGKYTRLDVDGVPWLLVRPDDGGEEVAVFVGHDPVEAARAGVVMFHLGEVESGVSARAEDGEFRAFEAERPVEQLTAAVQWLAQHPASRKAHRVWRLSELLDEVQRPAKKE